MDTQDLYHIAAQLSSASLQEVEALGASLLALPSKGRSKLRFRSTLNNDGSPLQLCLTSSRRSRSVRMLGDPGSYISHPAARLQTARDAVSRLGAAVGCESIAPLANRILQAVLPDGFHDQTQTSSGAMWIAAAVDQRGAAAYIKARWGSPAEDWLRALRLFQSVLPSSAEAEVFLRELKDKTRMMSVGIENTPFGDVRIKVYWRLTAPALLSSFSIPLLDHPALHRFLTTTLCNRSIPLTGLVFSTGFLLSNGMLEDVKADLCAHCVAQPTAAWLDHIDACAAIDGLQTFALRDCLDRWRAEVSFLGFAVTRQDQARLNVYLKSSHERQN